MLQNSIGQFMAALRKANGMTQQDVADRLNVSNKAVSRWERDECAPDISVIPALAEMFGVTCDELLRGERITNTDRSEPKGKRTEKQVKAAVNRAISWFKTMIMISLAVAVAGLVCMFGISYGFYRPVIGFVVMLLFEVGALVIAALAVSRTKDKKRDNELFEMADESVISRFENTMGTFAFWAFYVIFACVVVSLPFILETALYYVLHSYFTDFFSGILLFLTLVFLKCKAPCSAWIGSGRFPKQPTDEIAKGRRKMSVIQIAFTVLSGVLFVIAPYFETNFDKTPVLCILLELAGLACLAANIVVFFVFLKRSESDRTKCLTLGIRNILLIPSVWIVQESHQVGWWANPDTGMSRQRYENWNIQLLGYALALAAVVLILFSVVDVAVDKKRKND